MSTYATATVTFDYLDRDDMVTQTMAAFSSTTANCARCHAHKFDPISQEDYYALQAVFAGVLKGEISYDEDATVGRERKRWKGLIAAADKKNASILLSPENAPPVNQWIGKQGPGARWQPLDAETFLATEGSTLTRLTNGAFLSAGPKPDKDTYTITATTTLSNVTALRLNVLAHDSLPMRGPGRNDNGNLHLSEIELRVFEAGAAESKPVKLRRATADFNQAGWGIERALDGDIKTAWGIHPAVGQSHQAVFELAEPLALKPGSHLAIVLKQAHGGGHLIGAFSLAVTADDAANAASLPTEVEAAIAATAAERSETQRVAIAAHALRIVANAALTKLPPQAVVYAAASSVNILSGDPPRQAKALTAPKVVHVMHRGDFDKPRAVIEPGALSALTHLPARFTLKNPKDESERRAALADWLAHPDNVLTWRSIVNRVWHYQFGMRRRAAHLAEVARRVAQAAPEVIMPDAVHDAAPRQHVVGMRQPVGQRGAAFAFVLGILQREPRGQMLQRGERARLDDGAGLVKITTMQNVNDLGFRQRFRLSWRITAEDVH